MDLNLIFGTLAASEIALVAAFFIGLMAAVSPCPLATNITAVAYISKKLGNGMGVVIAGGAYTLGRMLTYMVIAFAIVHLGVEVMGASMFLQANFGILLGPVLLVSGLVMLEWLRLPQIKLGGRGIEELKKKLSGMGNFGAFSLGVLFALAFCPFSAVLYFGMLIPLALANSDAIFIPAVFSIATGLPVMLASLAFATGAAAVGKHMGKVQAVEQLVRRIAGGMFIAAGAYYLAVAVL